MLNFTPVRNREVDIGELTADLAVEDLRQLTNEMVNAQLALLAACTDEYVVFVPNDPEAGDPYAADAEDVDLAWTLGHVIVHVTASSDESAYLAVELARGAPYRGGRSRAEVPWETVTTIEGCRQRLEESRRMRLASLDMWPDQPDLENTFTGRNGKEYNAVVRFAFGLFHDDNHLAQIAEIVRQAKENHGNA